MQGLNLASSWVHKTAGAVSQLREGETDRVTGAGELLSMTIHMGSVIPFSPTQRVDTCCDSWQAIAIPISHHVLPRCTRNSCWAFAGAVL